MKVKHKKRLIKFGLPIAIILAIIVGILSFPNVTGSYSPYTSLGIIYFFNDWSAVNAMEYITMFAIIQFFIAAFILGILIFRFIPHRFNKQWWSSIFLIISMSTFLLVILIFTIWIVSGLFGAFLEADIDGNKTAMISTIIDYGINYIFPSLILCFALISLCFWLTHYIPTLQLPIKKHKFNYNVLRTNCTPWTGKNKQLKTICVIGLIIAGLEVILTVLSIHYSNSETEIFPHLWQKIWFGTMHHFTELSNLWVAIFFIIFLLNYKFKFLKTSSLITMTFTYISVTFIIADFLLAPFMILNHSSGMINMGFGKEFSSWGWIKTILFHVVTPVIVLIFFIFFCKSKRQYQPWKFGKIIPITMIFPILYLIYAITINFLHIEHLQIKTPNTQPIIVYGGISVYGYFTCINPDIQASVFVPDSSTPIWKGNLTNITWYVFAVILFLTLSFYYNWIERHTMALRYLREHRLSTHRDYHLHRN